MENYSWFKHRFNMSEDSRLFKLIDEEGARGYGSYLFIIEHLYGQSSNRLFLGQLKLIQQKGFPQAYLEKIVRNYGLFVIEGDMFSSAIDFCEPWRKEQSVSKKNTTEKRKKNGNHAAETKPETAQTMPRDGKATSNAPVTKPADQEAAAPVTNREITKTMSQKATKPTSGGTPENGQTVIVSSSRGLPANPVPTRSQLRAGSEPASNRTTPQSTYKPLCNSNLTHRKSLARVREEKNREEKNRKYLPHISPSPVEVEVEENKAILHWKHYLDEMQNDCSWLEVVFMKSGYGDLLSRHLKEAVKLFEQHIIYLGKGGELLKLSDVKRYFAYFTMAGRNTSQALRQTLLKLEAAPGRAAVAPPDPYRYEQRIDGKRTYLGCPIPANAPPRPSATSYWDETTAAWNS
ncbi:uncharacterized protein DUF4373 [Bacteroides heparinolyticus]|uniref:Uncharacterized protein DUF4373 n=1 Tax=Prevotella heparinolytica TaxID=28113 RepID=A0A4R2LI12_9BACE|nr:DUF4373 domain-containing protein [Bacteroides heparinolyticus]TCO89999.1 uncharacterized protein DUF4373 [Bacteroides heparinolyticus]